MPWGIAVAPDGEFLYVALQGDDQVAVVKTSDLSVVERLQVGVEPLYVAYFKSRVFAIETATNAVLEEMPVDDTPDELVISPDGAYLYVAHRMADAIGIISTSDYNVGDKISVWGPAGMSANVVVG